MDNVFEYRGAADLVYAEITKDTSDEFTFGTVKDLAGLAKVSKKTNSSSKTMYYDNKAAGTINSTGADDITLDVSGIPMDTLADITGQYFDSTTGMMVEQERTTKYFALGYKTKNTNGEEIYVWRLKGTFAIPDQENATENDGTDSNGQSLSYTGIFTVHKFTKNGGKSAKAVNVNITEDKISASAIENFFSTVQTPDSITPKTPTV